MVKGNRILRESNEKRILRMLRRHQAATRQDLVNLSGIGKNTVSVIIDRFLSEGIVKETGVVNENKVGRPKITISLIPSAIKELGISIEKEQINFSLYDYECSLIESFRIKNNAPYNVNSVLEILKKRVTSLVSQYPEIIGLGISLPGIIDSSAGIVKKSTQLGWKEVNLKAGIKSFFSGIIVIVNAVKALSLNGNFSDSQSTFYVRVRKGMGGSFIHNGKITFGHGWIAGEVGQLPLMAESGEIIPIEECLNETTVRQQMAASKFPEQILRQKAQVTAQLISTIIFMCNPEIIIIDAYYCLSPKFTQIVMEYLSKKVAPYILDDTKVNLNYFENLSQELGMANLVIDKYENISFSAQ